MPSSDYRQTYFGDFIALLMGQSPADLPLIRKDVETVARGADFGDPKQWSKIRFWADDKVDAIARQTIGDSNKSESGAAIMIAVLLSVMFIFMLLLSPEPGQPEQRPHHGTQLGNRGAQGLRRHQRPPGLAIDRGERRALPG
ncbi:hypothetical protein LP420_33790 [Massilia sp. B-10]|nr:hypothetical protein LP420_33790 [Massilia sp. B-10]